MFIWFCDAEFGFVSICDSDFMALAEPFVLHEVPAVKIGNAKELLSPLSATAKRVLSSSTTDALLDILDCLINLDSRVHCLFQE